MKKELEKLRHARSAKDFPNIDLEEDEHVVVAMTRTKLGLLGIWLFAAIVIILIIADLFQCVKLWVLDSVKKERPRRASPYVTLGAFQSQVLRFPALGQEGAS